MPTGKRELLGENLIDRKNHEASQGAFMEKCRGYAWLTGYGARSALFDDKFATDKKCKRNLLWKDVNAAHEA